MLATHQLVETHNGHEIWQRQPGFEFTPVMLGKIASFVVRAPDGQFSVFAFMYPLLASLEGDFQEERLLNEAVRLIEHATKQISAPHQQDLTFEYHEAAWVEVYDPRWWISMR
ncbi:MAG TPA: hypothetical protein VF201_10255 [Nitrolancea sp.]